MKKQYESKITERKNLENKIEELKKVNTNEFDEKNQKLRVEIENLNKQIEAKKKQQEEEISKRNSLKKSLKDLDESELSEKENKLIKELINLWGDVD